MSIAELSRKYGRTKARQSVNAAIRAELIGGSELIELTTKYESLARSARVKSAPEVALFEQVRDDLQRLRDVFGDEIARRYGLQTKLQRGEK